MKVNQLVPWRAEIDLQDVIDRMIDPANRRLAPFSPHAMGLCEELSRALFRHPVARSFPETQALAFRMRKTELERLRTDFNRLSMGDTLLVPRGLALHIPPANVDTIFMYSWMMSILAGNLNIIRLSQRSSQQVQTICEIFNGVVAASDDLLRYNTVMIQYGHDREITAALSSVCDIRVIWGGDAVVNSIRSIPVSPLCKEITFSDRYSWSLFHAGNYVAAPEDRRVEVAKHFYNDTYWFDQMACSSPRILVWYGPLDTCVLAADLFMKALRREITNRSYAVDVSVSLRKFSFTADAVLDGPVDSVVSYGNELTVLQLSTLRGLNRTHCGGGLLLQCYTDRLDECWAHVDRKDQTLTYFGFDISEIKRFASRLNGQGLDRIVPIGQALNFQRYWDGYDLMAEMTRQIYVA